MCGIAGQLDFHSGGPDRRLVAALTSALAHRGPDGSGEFAEGPIALGHRRLAIIDLAGGAQPQRSADGALAVVFNGEIYNFQALRRTLPNAHFRTRSDTEVLLHLYAAHGDGMLERLEGQFAFALWDGRRERLLLARDRFGEKPLVFCSRPGQLTFASELGPLRRALGDPPIDRRALAHYLELLYVPAPRTIHQGIEKLPAGHRLVADRQGVRITRYWRPPVPGSAPAATIDPAAVRRALQAAVDLRLTSDVPLGALLSGGLDSSAVVGLMAERLGPGIRTFAVGFGRADDELPFARTVAKRFATDHEEIVVSSDVAGQAIEALAAYGEPFGDSSAVPTVAVCREVAKAVKVVLTGDGGDELFAGYGHTARLQRLRAIPELPCPRAWEWAAAVSKPLADAGRFLQQRAIRTPGDDRRWQRLTRLARVLGSPPALRHRALTEVFSPAERAELLGAPEPPAPTAPLIETPDPGPPLVTDSVEAALAFDLGVYLPDDLLYKTDSAAMRFGLEGRAPLLDSQLAALVVPAPAKAKLRHGVSKRLLRAALADLLPPEILARPKRGFGSPVEAWLSGPLRGLLLDWVGDPQARIRGLLDGRAVDRVVQTVAAGRGNGHQGWALMALEGWARQGH